MSDRNYHVDNFITESARLNYDVGTYGWAAITPDEVTRTKQAAQILLQNLENLPERTDQ